MVIFSAFTEFMKKKLPAKRKRLHSKTLNIEQNQNIVTVGGRVEIDTVQATQELMLKFLEFGAFVFTDVLFQIMWPA